MGIGSHQSAAAISTTWLKRIGWFGAALLIANEIRGIIFVALFLRAVL